MSEAAIAAEQLRLSAIILIPMACIPAYIAKKKGRSFALWYIYAYGLFIFALLHALMLPPKQKNRTTVNGNDFGTSIQPKQIPTELIINTRRINYCFVGCPIDTLSYVLSSNFQTKTITAKLNLFAEKPVRSFDITLELLDSLKGKIADKTFTNVEYRDVAQFDVSAYPYVMYINFKLEKIYLQDGEVWERDGEPLEYDVDILDGYEQEKLKSLTNKYAVCLPYETEDYWVCSCTKANNADHCVMCGIDKKELFEKVDKDTVRQLKNDLIRRNNLSKFNVAVTSRQQGA